MVTDEPLMPTLIATVNAGRFMEVKIRLSKMKMPFKQEFNEGKLIEFKEALFLIFKLALQLVKEEKETELRTAFSRTSRY